MILIHDFLEGFLILKKSIKELKEDQDKEKREEKEASEKKKIEENKGKIEEQKKTLDQDELDELNFDIPVLSRIFTKAPEDFA